jgi:hypothetical protein
VRTPAGAAHLDWVRKVADDGWHLSVTDLAGWRGRTWLCFRRAHGHYPDTPGSLRVLVSDDLERWDLAAEVDTELDDRDPKLVPDRDRMGLFFASRRVVPDGAIDVPEGVTGWMESRVAWTSNGHDYGPPLSIGDPGFWLWAPVRGADAFWCAAYGCRVLREAPAQRVELFRSPDGEVWRPIAELLPDGVGNEARVWPEADGGLLVVVRGRGDETLLLRAREPWRDWRETRLPHWAHAPALARVGERLVLAGRDRDGAGGYVTRLWTLAGDVTEPLLDLPSGGDTSYPGLLARDDGTLLVSWYSQHEFQDRPDYRICHEPAAVYVAKVSFR